MVRVESLQDQLDGLRLRLASLEKGSAPRDGKRSHRELLQEISRDRVTRAGLFGCDFFVDSAWEIMLALYAAELDDRKILVSRVGEVSGIPQTTALRWIRKLEALSLLRRVPDPVRRQRIFAILTSQASTLMATYLDEFSRRT